MDLFLKFFYFSSNYFIFFSVYLKIGAKLNFFTEIPMDNAEKIIVQVGLKCFLQAFSRMDGNRSRISR